jgi:hypothetical protein
VPTSLFGASGPSIQSSLRDLRSALIYSFFFFSVTICRVSYSFQSFKYASRFFLRAAFKAWLRDCRFIRRTRCISVAEEWRLTAAGQDGLIVEETWCEECYRCMVCEGT